MMPSIFFCRRRSGCSPTHGRRLRDLQRSRRSSEPRGSEAVRLQLHSFLAHGPWRLHELGGAKAHVVSKDHAQEKNAAEAERLRTLGVQVNGGYVGDHVAISCALGNIDYDSGKQVEGIICEPDVFKIEEDDEVDFLILASGGVRDPLIRTSSL